MSKIPLPSDFEKRILADPFLSDELLETLETDVPVSIRINSEKTKPDFDLETKVPWCEDAFYLKERPSYIFDPLFHAGAYYPQEAGSMLLDKVMRQLDLDENPKILDLCASPGGKSTFILNFLKGKGYLMSNEVINARAKVLRENLVKWGANNNIVTNNDPKDFKELTNWFDAVLVDAPCSGEGMFRKDPKARLEWKSDSPTFCSARQKRILQDIWGSIKENGYLIYATCTFNDLENENNVQWLLENYACELIDIEMPEGILKGRNGIGHYALPNKVDSEGFFITVIKKTSSDNEQQKLDGVQKNFKPYTKSLHRELIDLDHQSSVFEWQNSLNKTQLFVLPKLFEVDFVHIQQNFRIQKLGTNIGEVLKESIVPSEELVLDRKIFNHLPKFDLDLKDALRYLRGETFESNMEKGYTIFTYKNENLGSIKHLGNRFNNLYPKEWRIKKQIS